MTIDSQLPPSRFTLKNELASHILKWMDKEMKPEQHEIDIVKFLSGGGVSCDKDSLLEAIAYLKGGEFIKGRNIETADDRAIEANYGFDTKGLECLHLNNGDVNEYKLANKSPKGINFGNVSGASISIAGDNSYASSTNGISAEVMIAIAQALLTSLPAMNLDAEILEDAESTLTQITSETGPTVSKRLIDWTSDFVQNSLSGAAGNIIQSMLFPS